MMFKPPSPAGSTGDDVTNQPMFLQIQQIRRIRTKFVIRTQKREARGYALLLAVLILSTVLAGATALANIVISGIRQTREVSNSIIAYAAAESDVEQALYELRKQDLLPSSHGPENGVTREVNVDQPAVPYRIGENDFASLPVSPKFTGNIAIPQWEVEQNCASSWIEISRVGLGSGDALSTDRAPHARTETTTTQPLTINIPAGTIELRIRALYCDIERLSVAGLNSRVIIKSTAEVAGAKQAIEVTVPREAPASGLFDFVLFSEEDLTKDVK